MRDEDVATLGSRDWDEACELSLDPRATAIQVLPLDAVREQGATEAARRAATHAARFTEGFWVHLDLDVLDDALNPAVDYRLPGGLSAEELSGMLATLRTTGRLVGLDITISNAQLDPDGRVARTITDALARGSL